MRYPFYALNGELSERFEMDDDDGLSSIMQILLQVFVE